MNFDFSALLVSLTFGSGIIWLIDSIFFAPGRNISSDVNTESDEKDKPKLPIIVEYAKSFFPIFLIVLILRAFIFEPFRIPSGSMMPTLLIGDFILVNKYDYGLRLPVLHNKFIENSTPERGDIVVFRYPEDPSIPFIKRVVGLPGDKISYSNKTLYINDTSVQQVLKGRYNARGSGIGMNGFSLRNEHLDEIIHEILVNEAVKQNDYLRARLFLRENVDITVPEGHYFVMGDNRDNSKDSRFWGFVPDENLVGRAFMIWMNCDGNILKMCNNGGVDFSRIGTIIK
ncbi:MAG: signal peptidase I [Proteobacteria bacterium]|nr:signal peptidase I [Pseudomonadota bacterium]